MIVQDLENLPIHHPKQKQYIISKNAIKDKCKDSQADKREKVYYANTVQVVIMLNRIHEVGVSDS